MFRFTAHTTFAAFRRLCRPIARLLIFTVGELIFEYQNISEAVLGRMKFGAFTAVTVLALSFPVDTNMLYQFDMDHYCDRVWGNNLLYKSCKKATFKSSSIFLTRSKLTVADIRNHQAVVYDDIRSAPMIFVTFLQNKCTLLCYVT